MTQTPRATASSQGERSQRLGPNATPKKSTGPDPDCFLENVASGDGRIIIKMIKYKYIDVNLMTDLVEHLIRDQIAKAVKNNEKMQSEADRVENSDNSEKSHLSRISIFDRIEDKRKRLKKRSTEKVRSEKKDDEAEKL